MSFNSVWMDWFHNFNCSLLVFIIFFILSSFFYLYLSVYFYKLNLSFQELEIFGCLFPVIFLLLQAFFSLGILFGSGTMVYYSELSVKIVGHQWYWTYEIGDNLGLEFDSYMKSTDMMMMGDYRLLDVDNRLVLPIDTFVRFILTSGDVIHSWALPSFFLKLDAISGILNVFIFKFDLVGIFYGQCSEICGANHSFMPIVVEVSLFGFFKGWLLLL